ncbi:protein unc-13 homolog B-like [Pleurodeles waltl]|uniref:protein unc-13 homolog B-like n=1 Tax=Pleurodeles waltl TaxID=8319 RepID=UPI003709398E
MGLLCVRVKQGKFEGIMDPFETYAILKVHNLKSCTVTRSGSEPSWEQDFTFDISEDEENFVVELWKKCWIWDKLLGSICIPLNTVKHAEEVKIKYLCSS